MNSHTLNSTVIAFVCSAQRRTAAPHPSQPSFSHTPSPRPPYIVTYAYTHVHTVAPSTAASPLPCLFGSFLLRPVCSLSVLSLRAR